MQALPALLEERSLVAMSPAGNGKTTCLALAVCLMSMQHSDGLYVIVTPSQDHSWGLYQLLKSMVRYQKEDSDLSPLLPDVATLKTLSPKPQKAQLLVASVPELADKPDLWSSISLFAVDNCEQITGHLTDMVVQIAKALPRHT